MLLTAAALALVASTTAANAQISLYASGGTYGLHTTSYRDIPFRTVVRQQYDFSCGSAALATLLRYHYARATNESEIFRSMYVNGDQAQIRKVGFSLLDIKRYLEREGIAADGYRASFAELETFKQPSIALVTVGAYKHFVVVKGVRDGKILIGDPAAGLRTYTKSDFAKIWSGIVFALHPAGGGNARYNDPAEWRPWGAAPVGYATAADTVEFARDLPPVFQVIQLTPLSSSRP